MKRPIKKTILFIGLLIGVFLGEILFAQNKTIVFEHYTVENGLSQSTANCLFQDSRGYIWIGTQDGLNLFNGKKFTIFYNNALDKNTLSNKWIYDVQEDKQGNIWVATLSGLNKFDRKTFSFQHFYHNSKNPRSLPQNTIMGLLIDKNNTMWLRSKDLLIRYYKNEFYSYEIPKDLFPLKRENKTIPLVETPRYIFTTSSNGLVKIDKKTFSIELIHNKPTINYFPLTDNNVTALSYDKKRQTLWIGTINGLTKLELQHSKFIKYRITNKDNHYIPIKKINAIVVDKQEKLWIGSDNGLLSFDPNTNKTILYQAEKNDPQSLNNNVITNLLLDASENLWIGTDGNGVDKIDLKPPKFKLYQRTANPKSVQLSMNIIASVYKDDDGKIWIGTWGKGLNIYDPRTNTISYYNSHSPAGFRINEDHVHSILKCSNGLIFLGTRQGITVYDPVQKRFTDLAVYYPTVEFPKFKDNRIYKLIEDSRNNIWIATQSGLYVFNLVTLETRSYFKTDGLADNSVIELMQDDLNKIWIGTANGLTIYDPDNKEHPFTTTRRNENTLSTKKGNDTYSTLSNNYINAIVQGENYYWIGTASGLNRYDPTTKTFKYYFTQDGLPNNNIYEIIIDNSNNLWISTNRGICKYNIDKNKFISYDQHDGLQGLEFNNGASYISLDGEIFFGGVNGLNSFYPQNMNDNNYIPNIDFNYFEIISTKSNKPIISQLLTNDTIHLYHYDKSLTIYYSTLEYTNPKKNQYSHFLSGDNHWTNTGNKNFTSYTNLDPGTYTFKIKGSNNDYVWSKEKTITIIVKPIFWKTIWAYIAYFLIIGGITFAIFQARVSKLKTANQLLEAKEEAARVLAIKQKQLEEKDKDITDSLKYAERIQRATMPTVYLLHHAFTNSFVFYQPKEPVSGDFYWFVQKENLFFVAAVDCTGHGVPGAFMSLIGINLLNTIIVNNGIEDTGEILDHMNKGLYDTLNKEIDDIALRDGMDLSLCKIDKSSKIVEFSGAMNPLYLIRDKNLIEINANRFSLGTYGSDEYTKFDTHRFTFKKDDMIYLFSDGFMDQFGGLKNKKYLASRFRQFLLEISPKQAQTQKKMIAEEYSQWKGNNTQIDDVTIIGIQF